MTRDDKASKAPRLNDPQEDARDFPAVFVNRFHILVNPFYTRLVMREAITDADDATRSVFVMLTSDAKELAQVILSTIETSHRTAKN